MCGLYDRIGFFLLRNFLFFVVFKEDVLPEILNNKVRQIKIISR